MPIHYVERGRLSERIAEIEASGEQIASVVAEGDNFQVFTVRPVAQRRPEGGIEKRPAR